MKKCHQKSWLRAAALLLAGLLIFTALPMPTTAAGFRDIPNNAWYREHVLDLVSKGIINGTSPTTFSPQKPLTRAAFVTMLAKTALTEQELSQYKFQGKFKDVSSSKWYNPYVNWAVENGVVSGYENNTFRPDRSITRQELARMITNFAQAVCRKMIPDTPASLFRDTPQIASYAKESVSLCQRCGIINGYSDNTFRPNGNATRAEASALYSRFLSQCPTSGDYRILRKRVNGIAIRAVEFDPDFYDPDIVLGKDLVDGREAVGSMIQRSGAVIAVNAAFFDMDSYMPYSTIIKKGRIATIDHHFAPARPAFTMDYLGNFSIESFSPWYTATLTKADGTQKEMTYISSNKWPGNSSDATRMVFTRDWGHDLCFPAKDAVTVNGEGIITSVSHDKDVPIPALGDGFVLAQRSRRYEEGDFFDSCQVGDRLDLGYYCEELSLSNLWVSIGSGPRLVKNGAVYGDLSTYKSEGFSDPNITTYTAERICAGIKSNGDLVFVNAICTLKELSSVMVSLGCTDAMNFDGGGSSNLYVDGFWLAGPKSRPMNNLLIFK